MKLTADTITVYERIASAGKDPEGMALPQLNALTMVMPSAANVRRYGQGHRTTKPVLSMRPRSYLIRRHTKGAWR